MILEVEHLSFAYRPERPLFYDVSFAFEQGQVLSILGANGAGKSTLLNCIANLLRRVDYPPQLYCKSAAPSAGGNPSPRDASLSAGTAGDFQNHRLCSPEPHPRL